MVLTEGHGLHIHCIITQGSILKKNTYKAFEAERNVWLERKMSLREKMTCNDFYGLNSVYCFHGKATLFLCCKLHLLQSSVWADLITLPRKNSQFHVNSFMVRWYTIFFQFGNFCTHYKHLTKFWKACWGRRRRRRRKEKKWPFPHPTSWTANLQHQPRLQLAPVIISLFNFNFNTNVTWSFSS